MSDTSATFEARRPPTGVGDGVELIAWCRQMREHHPVVGRRDPGCARLQFRRHPDRAVDARCSAPTSVN